MKKNNHRSLFVANGWEMPSEELGQLLPPRAFGTHFQELYKRHWVRTCPSKENGAKHTPGWRSRFRVVLPLETCSQGLFITTALPVAAELEKAMRIDYDIVDEEFIYIPPSCCSDTSRYGPRFKHLLFDHWAQSDDGPIPARQKSVAKVDHVIDDDSEESEGTPGHPFGLVYRKPATNGGRFMYLFNDHWNVYIPGTYGSSLDCRSVPFEASAILEDDSEQNNVAARPSSSQLRWKFLRTCVKEKSMGARFYALFHDHFNVYTPANQSANHGKPENIWRVKFRFALLHPSGQEQDSGLASTAAPKEEESLAKKLSEKGEKSGEKLKKKNEQNPGKEPAPTLASNAETTPAKEKGAPSPPHDILAPPEMVRPSPRSDPAPRSTHGSSSMPTRAPATDWFLIGTSGHRGLRISDSPKNISNILWVNAHQRACGSRNSDAQ
jgi:hypothetical protein